MCRIVNLKIETLFKVVEKSYLTVERIIYNTVMGNIIFFVLKITYDVNVIYFNHADCKLSVIEILPRAR